MEKKRIAIFAEKLYGGGVEKILHIICHNFDYGKYDVTLYSSRYEEMPEDTYPADLHHNYYFDSFPGCSNLVTKFLGKAINKLKLFVYYRCSPQVFYKLFVRKKYDVGIAFIEGYATRIVSGAPIDMKKICWVHTDMTDNHWTSVAFHSDKEEKSVYCSYDKVVCVSKKAECVARSLFGIQNTLVLHNPIDVASVVLKSTVSKIEKRQNVIRIVSLGALIKVKGYERLLRVLRRLDQNGKSIELMILGEGSLRPEFETFIRNNNLQNVVKLIGFVDNPYPYLLSADIYVCSSYAEGFNTAITEALILGRAVVATDISGVREQLGENSEYGIIVENSEEGIYCGLSKMMQNNNITYYQQKASERREVFNLNRQMQAIYNLIES